MPPKNSRGGKSTKPTASGVYNRVLPIFPFTVDENAPEPHAFDHHKANRTLLSNPQCTGVLDTPSKSVWVVNSRDVAILWQRGFFGKGNLSRSEPTWLTRRTNELKGSAPRGGTAEEARAKRRVEREKFKTERAEAMAAAQAEAEAQFLESKIAPELGEKPATSVVIPSNKNKAKAPASARPSSTSTAPLVPQPEDPSGPPRDVVPIGQPSEPSPSTIEPLPESSGELKSAESNKENENPEIQEMEHLQLTLPEAFFLAWALGCLRVLDPATNAYLSTPELFTKSLEAHLPFCLTAPEPYRRPDNPFLIHYVIYHHFRSLGWVIRGGIKFCVDYLLYKKGPVFHHAEFSLVVCPVYEDPKDQESSPFELSNAKPMDWAWFSTVNRVNSQVKKTLVLVYVTIPSTDRMSAASVSLDHSTCLSLYSVREVVARRFIPARMRD
ncbi:tRNA splicing endonuclease subunit sen2 [Tulasnella sp. 424]|nr:tRNA splicing endonuclease subunit sen2 [Tulasnella sp. 424]KAG8975822.1 tRNA splicing endonuclease subunit sen2 [Tulasnella sp. 425]